MSFFGDDDDRFNDKISLDELYDRKRTIDHQRLSIYNKILQRVHKRIKMTSRQQYDQQFCVFVVPEFVFGVPRYDVAACISYIIDKLETNGFNTKYTHPNMIFISWKHYIPSYQREKIRQQTGVKIDGFGNVVKDKKEEQHTLTFNNKKSEPTNKKIFKDINSYKPTGGLIYDKNLLDKLKDKMG